MNEEALDLVVDYKPHFPAGSQIGIGVIGCGGVVKLAHLPAYQKYGQRVVGAYDISPEATRGVQEKYGVENIFGSLDELLSRDDIQVVDIATHPAQRMPLIRRALEAGKHVLSQKPLALEASQAEEIIEQAERRGLILATNQNGRWAPAWRVATRLVQQGAIGDVLAVTHLQDVRFGWITGTAFDDIPHFVIYDYSIHWIDIIRCWMENKQLVEVRARDYRTPHQPSDSKTPWGALMEFSYADGASAVIRSVGCSSTGSSGHPFWIHGTEGTIRGSALGNDFVELERQGIYHRYHLEGSWFPDGFAGSMAELMSAVAENREPYNSARHNLLSLKMTLAACESADHDGTPVPIKEGC